MKPRTILDRTTTPDGAANELAVDADGHHSIRLAGSPLMSSASYGSEQAMATVAHELLGKRANCKVLVGGLGMGFTCRAALDEFGADAEVTVAELLPSVVGHNHGPLGTLADHPLLDERTRLFDGDVRELLTRGAWDAILIDVDDGPDARTTPANKALFSHKGIARLARALRRTGVLVVWSAYASPAFEATLRRTDLAVETRRVYARAPARKGPKHTLFIGRATERP